MKETPEDLSRLQALLDRSFEQAGSHLLSIITPKRRPSADQIASRLTGMSLLALATVSGDGRPFVGPVDGIFFRGSFHFGSSPDSVRLRHISERPSVSAAHLPGEEFAVTVHGRAVMLDTHATENRELRATLLDVYAPTYGSEWEDFLDSGPVYARIDAEKMFAFASD
jgi:nitroimidazol reductase NimA-like FMN-containing flavoprotein (pyridoxamine 5'-phosphate oxidase superfamily)